MTISDISVLIDAYSMQVSVNISLGNKITGLEAKLSEVELEIQRLKELLSLEQARRFGKSGERQKSVPEKNNDDAASKVQVQAHARAKRKPGRLLGTDHLPHFQKIYELPEDGRKCELCGAALHVIGKESTKQAEIIPLRYCIVEHIQMKYGCRPCGTIQTPAKPIAPIPKAIAGASLLTEVIINKYHFSQPLYRQSKKMKDDGLLIPDNTLGHWVIKMGFAFEQIYDAMWDILCQRYLQVDETPVKILKSNKKGYLWAYYAPHIGQHRGLVVFELSETREGSVAYERLKEFKGLLQTDGYAGYAKLRQRQSIVGLGCLTHARRKFTDVVKITGDKNGIAAEMLEKLKPLYALEASLREMKASFHTRKRLRQKIAYPIVKHIRRWLMRIKGSVLPKSKLGEAIKYLFSQWRYIFMYLRHGIAEIDTNNIENLIREVALGKKNWLFIGNKDSGKVHAIFYSLVISCVLNEINPRVYIHYIMTQLHDIRRQKIDVMALLPHTISRELLTEFSNEQIRFAQHILNTS